MKKPCELCKRVARMHCESDQASLCWDCDAMVHSANFLVARHSRNLLCHVCQSPTPWSAAGAKLRPVVSVCEQCVINRRICDEEDEENSAAEEEIEENQIVPWSPPPPAVVESSSSSEEPESGGEEVVVCRKRCRLENSSSNHPSCSHLNTQTPPWNSAAEMAGVCGSPGAPEPPMKRFHRNEAGSCIEMPELHASSNNRIAIDLNFPMAIDLNSSISS